MTRHLSIRRLLRDHVVFIAVVAIVIVAYGSGAAEHVLGHDNGEYLVVGSEGGVAHPPGYPAYVLWLRAWSWLPAASAAHTAALATAMLGIATTVTLYAACCRWYCSRTAAALATAVFALSPRAWLLNGHAENLALSTLLAALILLVAAPQSQLHPGSRAALLGLLAGLGLSCHHSIVLLAPVGLWALARALRRAPSPGRSAMVAVGASLVGLAPHLYMLEVALGAGERWVWGTPDSVSRLMAHVLRAEYGFRLTPQLDMRSEPLRQLGVFAQRLSADLLWLPALIGVAALVAGVLAARLSRRGRLLAPMMLAVTFLTTGPLMVCLLNITPAGTGLYQLARFYLLPELVLSIFVARGLHQLLRRLRGPMRRPMQLLPVAAALLAAWSSLPTVREAHRPTVEHYLRNTLTTLPQDAVLMATGDLRLFGFLYLQRIERLRADVTFISPTMLFRPWYRERIEGAVGSELVGVGPDGIDMVALSMGLMATGRPLLIMDVDPNHLAIIELLANHPHGTAIRILPPNVAPPTTDALVELTQQLFARYQLESEPPGDPDGFGAWVYRDYARPWHFLAAELRERGQPQRAAELEARAATFEQTR